MNQGQTTQITGEGTTASSGAPSRRVRGPLNGGWVLMIGAGLLAAIANYAVLTMDAPTAEVVVVDQTAPAGTPVSQLRVSVQRLAITDPSRHGLAVGPQLPALAEMVTAQRLDAGVMLRHSDVRPSAGSESGAMSIPVDATRAAGGGLQSGDQIDVIADSGGTADYVATGLDVLDVVIPGTGVGQTGGGYAVTVAVDAEQAVALARALRAGEIDLVRTAQAGGR